MADFEREADFAAGDVLGASFGLRPDAVVSSLAVSPGPLALGNIAEGMLYKGWYARQDNDDLRVLIAESNGEGWGAATTLFTFAAPVIEMLSLAFDATARAVVAMERAGNIWIRYWDGAAYQLTNLGTGEAPAIIHRAPDTPFSELVLFYQRAGDLYYRYGSEDYATEWDAGISLGANQKLWRAILGQANRLHLILSTRDEVQGTYSLQRISETEPYTAACLDAEGYAERIDDGAFTLLVFRDDGSVTTLDCSAEFDALLIAAGGNSGGFGQGQPSRLWCTLAGLGLDPDEDAIPQEHEADGGGGGATDDRDGVDGASGGGGGGRSPSANSMWTQGGGGIAGQGYAAGGGRSTWGILTRKRAASGGGGGYGGPGEGASSFSKGGEGGPGGVIPGWNWSGPKGGRGWQEDLDGPTTGDIPGGGGSGGVMLIAGLGVPPNQYVPVKVGQAGGSEGGPGQGGKRGGAGISGMLVIRIQRLNLDTFDWAVLTGGVVNIFRGYRYHKYLSTGTVTVTTPGRVESLVVAAGAGGGSGAGGGGGGADMRVIETLLQNDTPATIGAGGSGGAAGGAGSDGGDSSLGSHALAEGGGGGAGNTGAAGSRASGGGGSGDGGAGGAGKAMRAYPGGPGGGFALQAGGDSLAAGGGGGAGGEGERGATQETQGDELADHWEVPAAGDLEVGEQRFHLLVVDAAQATLIGTDVAAEAMMVQGKVMHSHQKLASGVMARARHPTGDPNEVATGYHASISGNSAFFTSAGSVAYFMSLSTWHHVQLYAEDDLQEYSLYGQPDPVGPFEIRRIAGTDAGENGNVRGFGFRCIGTLPTGGGKNGFCDDIMCFASKYLEIGNLSAGDYVEVLDLNGVVVATAPASVGTALVDLSMYGDGSAGATEPVPLAGWGECVVRDSGDAVLARTFGSFYPGGEYDFAIDTLDIRIDSSGPEPIPVTGVLQLSQFDELTPGPENGDGGDGRSDLSEWSLALGEGEDDHFAGGGGGGAEIFLAGPGGIGGGGDGAFAAEAPGDGVANTGGGGGGSGDSGVDGGAGGSGLVAVRTLIPMPAGAEIPTSGLVAHHDARLIAGFTNDEVLTAWEDLTAEGNDLGNQGSPLYHDGSVVADSIQGWPCVRTLNNGYLKYATAFLNGNTEGEIFVVLKNDDDAPGTRNGLWKFNTPDLAATHPWGDEIVYESWGRTVRINAGNPAADLSAAHLYHVKSVAGEYTVRLNGTQLFTDAAGVVEFDNVIPDIGRSQAGSDYAFKGLWGHVLVYDRELTPAERTSIEDYLTWYWGLDY